MKNQFSLVKRSALLALKYFYFFAPNTYCARVVCTVGKQQAPFGMAIGYVELMHECFPKKLANMNSNNEIRQRDRRRRDP